MPGYGGVGLGFEVQYLIVYEWLLHRKVIVILKIFILPSNAKRAAIAASKEDAFNARNPDSSSLN
jgi:hypothetical protein